MAEKQVQAAAASEAEVVMQRAKGFWDKFSKPIIYVGSALILLVGGYFGYKYFYKIPKEQKASEAIISAENLFDKMATNFSYGKDSVKVLLDGGTLTGFPKITGLLSVIKNYGGTEAGNRAHYLAGAAYLHIGEFDKAIKQLKEFDPNGSLVAYPYYDMLAAASAELKKDDDALSYYKKAAAINEKNEQLTPVALKKAADFAYQSGKLKDAAELYQKIKDDYPKSQEAQNVDKDLARLGKTE